MLLYVAKLTFTFTFTLGSTAKDRSTSAALVQHHCRKRLTDLQLTSFFQASQIHWSLSVVMDTLVVFQLKTFPFFKLPAELRNMIYRYCLDVQKSEELNHGHNLGYGDELTHDEFVAQGSAHLSISFDDTILGVCRQIQQEAVGLFSDRVGLFIDIEQPKRVWICRDKEVGLEPTPIGLPRPLQQILPYAPIFPLQDLWIRMLVGTRSREKYMDGLLEPIYRRRIH
ncbi:MAG: hypothetical protein L6R39_000925 [Caloplaca ligustica]|nr:MAG: hypothetical protein L6R39_000925 [Caloplaca ligustica]